MKTINKIFITLISILMIFTSININNEVYGSEKINLVSGKLYKLDKKSSYDYSSKEEYEKIISNSMGLFQVSGSIKNTHEKQGIPCYSVDDESVKFSYEIGKLNTDKDSWHIISDDSKTVDDVKLDEKIGKGVLIVQTSKDNKKWITEYTNTNIFNSQKTIKDFYETSGVQLVNGTYYRVIVAYESRIREGETKTLFITNEIFKYKKNVELYEFYLYDEETEQYTATDENKHSLGETVNTGKDTGYSKEKEMTNKDPHYGWELGNFFVKGYTSKITENKDSPVFLKNVGDKVTLYFNLKQDIDKLNNNANLTIYNDANGYDQYFQTGKTDFGRGTLIIRYTDPEGVKHEPNIYTNYLEANVSPGADTVVQLFEEGDYEVSLDYEIKENKFMAEYYNYKIFFKFSVRNGNCMVFSFDAENGNELLNGSNTTNGFKIDLAKSKYLSVNVKKEVVVENENGYDLDTRFNRPAKDGEVYTDEGIYTITVKNHYTNEETVKKISVGDNQLIKAHMKTGMSINDINHELELGASIDEEGNLLNLVVEEDQKEDVDNTQVEDTKDENIDQTDDISDNIEEESSLNILPIVSIAVIVLGAVFIVLKKRK